MKRMDKALMIFSFVCICGAIGIVVALTSLFDKPIETEVVSIEKLPLEVVESVVPKASIEKVEVEIIESPVAEPIEEVVEVQKVWDDIKLTKLEQTVLWNKCEELHLNYWLILALCESESSFIPDAVGDSGNSIGYMQINKCNWDRMNDEYNLDVHEPIDNLVCGAVIIRELLDKYETITQVIMSYKCGESRAKELLEQGVVLSSVETIVNRAIELEQIHSGNN